MFFSPIFFIYLLIVVIFCDISRLGLFSEVKVIFPGRGHEPPEHTDRREPEGHLEELGADGGEPQGCRGPERDAEEGEEDMQVLVDIFTSNYWDFLSLNLQCPISSWELLQGGRMATAKMSPAFPVLTHPLFALFLTSWLFFLIYIYPFF